MVLLFFLNFFLCFLLLSAELSKRSAFVFSWIYMLAFIYVSTEILSIFNALYFFTIFSFHAVILLMLSYLIYRKKELICSNWKAVNLKQLNKSYGWYFDPLILIGFTVGFIAIYSPPNNWDSLAYHLGRMMHWIQNQNIEHYPTHVPRELFNPPLVEYVFLQLYLLSGGDQWLNCIQFISFIGCIVSTTLILKSLGKSFKVQIISAIVVATIPMAILQATNTKNELTVAFFVTIIVYFLFEYKRSKNIRFVFYSAICTGLAFATKSSAYVYLLPIYAVFFLFLFLDNYKKAIIAGLLILSIGVTISLPVYIRNYKTYEHPLGATPTQRSWFACSEFSWKSVVSNVSKNSYIHLANVKLFDNYELFNANGEFFNKLILDLHKNLEIDINNPNITWHSDMRFNLSRDEDYAGNYLHFFAILFAMISIVVFWKKIDKNMLLLLLSVIGIVFFFSAYLKWQEWHSRLHIPIFILGSVLITIQISKLKPAFTTSILILFFAGSFTYLVENNTRGLLFRKPKIYQIPRDELMFIKKGNALLNNLKKAGVFIKLNNIDTLGLIIDGDAWDYCYFKFLKKDNPTLKIVHVNVKPEDTPETVQRKFPKFQPQFVISSLNQIDSTLRNYSVEKKFETITIFKYK